MTTHRTFRVEGGDRPQVAAHTDGGSERDLVRKTGRRNDWIRHAHGQAGWTR